MASEGASSPLWVRNLPYFDQMTVGIADVAALLVRVLFRRRQELSTPGAPFRVHGIDVFDPDIEEAADPVGIAWRLQGKHSGLWAGWQATADWC
jgi:hypothetical protein